MGKFTDPLLLRPDPRSNGWLTDKEFSYDVGYKGSGVTVTIPANLHTDLASIPKILWWFLPPHDSQYAAAAVMHDYLYSHRTGEGERFSRVVADSIFYEALLVLGVPRLKALIMFFSLRTYWIFTGGWKE